MPDALCLQKAGAGAERHHLPHNSQPLPSSVLPAVGEGDPGRAAAAAPEERLPGAGTRPSLPPLPLQGIPSRRARRVPSRQRLRHRCRRWQRRCRIDAPPSFSVGTDRVDLPSAGSTGSASPTPPTSSPTTSPASPSPCQGRPRRLTATGAPACGRQEGLRSHYAGEGGAAAHSTVLIRATREPGREASMQGRAATIRCRDQGRRAGRRRCSAGLAMKGRERGEGHN
ncbi:uncharacterized protein LOC119321249 [Triticum dicoccoides]|uniref:uncharacterized protein LOC119321249 n=1 Tax=Triticum dicoccoides TaxID=85692 RepID=UPI001891D5E2|nr:uncharacterized protein LOC119321249 [Triticum dicoccoides]